MNPDSFLYLLIDKSTGGYSCSRVGLFLMNIMAVVTTIWLLYAGAHGSAAAVVTGVAATDAGVYFKSTAKE